MSMSISTIDLFLRGVPKSTAAYLLPTTTGPILVECGPTSTLPALTAALQQHGYAPADVRHVFVTHIHLDHAGSAGWWARQGAQIYVHHRGVPHVVDPAKLIRSATRIYGSEMEQLWGEIYPAPADRVTPVYDGDEITVGEVTLQAVDTPGHAYHHHAWRLGDIAFTGDAAASRVPETGMIDLPAPPPEFDLEAWLKSLAHLQALNLSRIYLTHFDAVSDVKPWLDGVASLLQETTHFIGVRYREGLSREDILADVRQWQRERGAAAGLTAQQIAIHAQVNPHEMSVDGILRYWRKKGSA